MKYYCEQCGEEIKDGDDIIRTHFHVIHEECEDDYIDMMREDWTYETFKAGED